MKDTAKHWILIGSFTLVLAALAVCLPLLFSGTKPKKLSSVPVTVITPEPKTEEDDVLIRTPAPTPVPVITTPVPVYPKTAVNLLADGKPLFAVASREVAEYLVRAFLDECASENLSENAILLTASIDAALSTVRANAPQMASMGFSAVREYDWRQLAAVLVDFYRKI